MCKEKITEQQKQLFILKLNSNNNNNNNNNNKKKKKNTHLLNFYSLTNILHTGETKSINYLCALIDLFTDTAVILNLLDVRSIMGCPGATRSVFTCAFWAKRELQCIFLAKKAIIIISKHSTTIFFSDYNRFQGKLKEKLARKALINTDASILDRPHAPPPGIP